MGKLRLKSLDMNSDNDKKILLTYFFKKLDTKLDAKSLLELSCIYYNSKDFTLQSLTKRFQDEFKIFKDKKVLASDVDNTLKEILHDRFRLQEELVRCDLPLQYGTDHFYIAVIGADFYQIETEIRKEI